jgi:lysozyme family protein
MTDLVALKAANASRWAIAKITQRAKFVSIAKYLIDPKAKERYQWVTRHTDVPWAVIAVIHERESSQDWTGSLAQGDPWNHVSVHKPAGRGPFKSWEEAAIDALVNCAPYASHNAHTARRLQRIGLRKPRHFIPIHLVWYRSIRQWKIYSRRCV